MSDAIDKTWQALDEDLQREEAESPFELERCVHGNRVLLAVLQCDPV